MPLLQLRQVTLRYSAAPLLQGADLQIDAGERVCLVGRNGAGKTSLLRLITGEEQPQEGEISRASNLFISRLPQDVPAGLSGSVHDVVHAGMRLAGTEEPWQADVRVEELLAEMGLPPTADFAALSGGMKRRVLLARALAGAPDLLLLDEPTNHLDLDSILWLEAFLLRAQPTLLFITHDRAFLRRLATRIVELDRGRLTSWACDYDTFLLRRDAVLEAEEKQRAAFDKKLAQEEAWLRQGVKARRTRNEGRVRALLAMRTERAAWRARDGAARLALSTGATSGQKVIEAKDVTFAYGAGAPVVRGLSTTIWRGDKIGILGPNGSGKTTLLKLLLGQLAPTEGEVQLGTRLEVVYLDQLRGQIDDAKTVGQNVAGDAETVTFQGRPRHLHSYLQDFLFPADRVRMRAKMLSGGERNRLLLARLFLQPANVLVLDEPTNDLDAETLELLEALLVEYTGTLLLVSHDRAFLDEVVTGTLIFEGGGRVTEYTGGYEDWVRQRPALPETTAPAAEKPASPPPKSGRAKKMLNRDQRELEQLPGEIEKLEIEREALAKKLEDPALYQDGPVAARDVQAQLEALEKRLQERFARWEALEALRASLR